MFVKVFRCCAVADDEDESNEAEDEKRCGEEMKKKALGHGERAAGPGAPRICGGTGAAAADAAPPAAGKIDAVAGCAEDHSSRASSSSCATNTGPQQREEAVASRPAPSPERARVQDAQSRIHPTSGLALMLGPGCREEADDDETDTVEIHYSQDDDQMFFFSDEEGRSEEGDA
ncbi:hypothetical protein DIPPA_35292 [Diplonema papillatum]|nr:hypothetical protein DIPPA_35292 [Diplonema papillatum]